MQTPTMRLVPAASLEAKEKKLELSGFNEQKYLWEQTLPLKQALKVTPCYNHLSFVVIN